MVRDFSRIHTMIKPGTQGAQIIRECGVENGKACFLNNPRCVSYFSGLIQRQHFKDVNVTITRDDV